MGWSDIKPTQKPTIVYITPESYISLATATDKIEYDSDFLGPAEWLKDQLNLSNNVVAKGESWDEKIRLKKETKYTKPSEYHIKVNQVAGDDLIVLKAADEEGMFCAVKSLVQIYDVTNTRFRRASFGGDKDYSDWKKRAYTLNLHHFMSNNTPDKTDAEDRIKEVAKLKYNTLIIQMSGECDWPTNAEGSQYGKNSSYTSFFTLGSNGDIRDLANLAREYGMEVIPALYLGGHADWQGEDKGAIFGLRNWMNIEIDSY